MCIGLVRLAEEWFRLDDGQLHTRCLLLQPIEQIGVVVAEVPFHSAIEATACRAVRACFVLSLVLLLWLHLQRGRVGMGRRGVSSRQHVVADPR